MMNFPLLCRPIAGLCLSLVASSLAMAQEPAVLARQGAVVVTTQDVSADLQRIPAQSRAQVASNPANIAQITSNLMVRRVLAAEAGRDGLENDPAVAAALRIAQDRVLSDAYLVKFAALNMPTTEAIDGYAHSKYQADSKRFEAPMQTRARHILVEGNTPEARAKAEKWLADLRGGADFAMLAQAYSEDPGSATKGGDLGFFPEGKMVAPFDAALKELKNPGELSGVVETQFGFHIIRLEERQPASSQSYDEVREQLRAEITAKLQKNARTQALERLRTQAEGDADQLQSFIATQKQEQPAASAADAAAVQPAAPKAAP